MVFILLLVKEGQESIKVLSEGTEVATVIQALSSVFRKVKIIY